LDSGGRGAVLSVFPPFFCVLYKIEKTVSQYIDCSDVRRESFLGSVAIIDKANSRVLPSPNAIMGILDWNMYCSVSL
jgi:hypothetical protein